MDATFGRGIKAWLGTQNSAYARTLLNGLVLACPQGAPNRDCPLREVRSLPLEEKKAWINALSCAEVEQLFSHHYACLKEDKT